MSIPDAFNQATAVNRRYKRLMLKIFPHYKNHHPFKDYFNFFEAIQLQTEYVDLLRKELQFQLHRGLSHTPALSLPADFASQTRNLRTALESAQSLEDFREIIEAAEALYKKVK